MELSSLNNLFAGFATYLEHISMEHNTFYDTLSIKYTPYMYDLIDQDLDFDEAYYQNMIHVFEKMLEKEVNDALHSETRLVSITVQKTKQLGRFHTVLESTTTYTKLQNNAIAKCVHTVM